MPIELTAYAQDQRDRLAGAKQEAQASLAQAQSDYTQARAAMADARGNFTALEAEVARIRAKLAAIITPADAEPLLAELSEKTVELRSAQAAALDAEANVRLGESAVERAGAEVARLTALLAGAESALAAATERAKSRDALFAKAGAAPLSEIAGPNGAAHDALQNPPYTTAKARVEAEIPQPLRELAAKRRENEGKAHNLSRDLAGFAETKIGEEFNQHGGATGKSSSARAEFARAEDDLRDFVARAKERFDQAQSLLAAVADSEKDPLTAEQKEEIEAGDDSDLKAARDDAAAKALAVENKQGAVLDAKLVVEQAKLAALLDNVDADPSNADAVILVEEDLGKANDELDTAKGEYTAEMKELIDRWEAAVPDSAWRRLDYFLLAEALLKALEGTKADELVTTYQTKEDAYATALTLAAKRARTAARLEAERAHSAALVEFHTAVSDRLLFSALRGDK